MSIKICEKSIATVFSSTKTVDDAYLENICNKFLLDGGIDFKFFFDKNEANIILQNSSQIISLLEILKNHKDLSFKMLIDVSAVDYVTKRNGVGIYGEQKFPQQYNNKRFDVVYHLLSFKLNKRIRIKLPICEGEFVDSASQTFSSACWFEREVFDMFGIKFSNSPDMRRILTDYNFEGHPLQKNFPLSGFYQVKYDEKQGCIVKEEVKLNQEYRDFDFENPWSAPIYNIIKANN